MDGGEWMVRGRRERDGWRGRREVKGRECVVVVFGISVDVGIWGCVIDVRVRDDVRVVDGVVGVVGIVGIVVVVERRGVGERRMFVGEWWGVEVVECGIEVVG